ncbi:MAG: alpha/beta fold hydrolase [Parcubacteria group bacterium]|jgi:carboxylesterase
MVGKILRKTKSILFANPKLLYEKEKHLINKSFYFKGTNRKAVLLLHGWSATPYEVRRLGKYLNEAGYTVYGPTLTGHGTSPEDLENVKYETWLNDTDNFIKKLKDGYEKVYVGGTSMGATLALCAAKNHPDIAGLILMAMPYKVRYERTGTWALNFLKIFKKYRKKIYPPTFGSRRTITRLISYQEYPISSVLELAKLIKKSRECLAEVTQPCFIMQSSTDHIVTKSSMKNIYKKIGSQEKKKKYIRKSYHTFISDIKNENVFEEILKFIESI